MYKSIISLALLLACSAVPLFAQQDAPNQDETLFRSAHLRGGFAAPSFHWSHANGKTGYGAGGGLGLVFDQFFIGFAGMAETFEKPQTGIDQLAMGYGGLWIGYTYPTYKLAHLYTSLKIGGGSVGTVRFNHGWDTNWDVYDENWNDVVFVVHPEAGVEVNLARWLRLSGAVGYRYVGDFEGWNNYGKHDLNALTFGLTLRLGWFGGGK